MTGYLALAGQHPTISERILGTPAPAPAPSAGDVAATAVQLLGVLGAARFRAFLLGAAVGGVTVGWLAYRLWRWAREQQQRREAR